MYRYRVYIEMYKFILNRCFSTEKTFIRNTRLPVCSKCIYFMEHTNNYPYDFMPNDALDGKCKKFGEKSLVTGEILYDLARTCRMEDKCGNVGRYYIEKPRPQQIRPGLYPSDILKG